MADAAGPGRELEQAIARAHVEAVDERGGGGSGMVVDFVDAGVPRRRDVAPAAGGIIEVHHCRSTFRLQ